MFRIYLRSHICVACRSVCDRDQSGIKRSTFFWSWSRDQDEFWATNINNQSTFLDTMEAWLRFALWTPVKSSDQEPRNGAIKWSRTIFTDQDSWSRLQTLLRATRMWLPLVGCVLDSEERFATVSGIVFLQGEEQQLRSSRTWWLTFVTQKCEKSSWCQN